MATMVVARPGPPSAPDGQVGKLDRRGRGERLRAGLGAQDAGRIAGSHGYRLARIGLHGNGLAADGRHCSDDAAGGRGLRLRRDCSRQRSGYTQAAEKHGRQKKSC